MSRLARGVVDVSHRRDASFQRFEAHSRGVQRCLAPTSFRVELQSIAIIVSRRCARKTENASVKSNTRHETRCVPDDRQKGHTLNNIVSVARSDACIVPVSVPVCHLDSRQLQQPPPPSLMNNQQHQLQHQNNPPHLAYQQANHHSYTTVTTSNQHGPSHLPPGGGVMGVHQQGPVPPHLQQQGKGRGGVVNRVVGSNMPGMQGPGQHLQQQDYQGQQQMNQPYQQQQNQPYQQQQNQPYQQQQQLGQPSQGYSQQPVQQFQQSQPQQQLGQPFAQQNQPGGLGMQIGGPQSASKPMRGIPAVIPTAQSKTQPMSTQQQQQQPQQQSTGPNLMQKFTEMAGASAGGDILSKGKELIFMKFGLGK
ncbi:PREDICTED: nuclear transcription factor Y subunit beta-like [Vollenhovia emeryi]|uniref:nuclear transcription factor Y subunit beta-like n=1 Tax=Vollenhovia emeryi TaxID=411798 RepID=UPI0005F3E214|nr:PREDICTED: nuclear transcription factor Y subunit beta-like [Vollenhovia emeryi]